VSPRHGALALIVIALVLVPLTAIPLYLVGQRVANALDDDSSNGVFALGVVLGVGGPALLATIVAWRRARPAIAVALGLASGAIAVAVLLASFVVYCSAVACIV
jgi:hypothetical protein